MITLVILSGGRSCDNRRWQSDDAGGVIYLVYLLLFPVLYLTAVAMKGGLMDIMWKTFGHSAMVENCHPVMIGNEIRIRGLSLPQVDQSATASK